MNDAVLCERIARHGFTSRPARTVAEAAALTAAIQAQDHPAARLGVRSRSTGLCDADVVAAVADTRTVVRTWLMRGTIHLVDTADLRWLTAVFGPALQRRFATRWKQLGLTQAIFDRSIAALPEVLAGGPGTRAEVVAALNERGVRVPVADPQAGYHMLMHATSLGLVCRGADRGRTATFALISEWVPDATAGPQGDDALAELARRYFRAFSPATAVDFGAWSRLPTARAIDLIRDDLTPVDVYGRPGFRLGHVEPARGVRLLAGFDNYLIGYKERAFIDDARRGEVYEGGWIRPTVLRDGRLVGRWQLGQDTVTVVPFETFAPATQRAVAREVDDIAAFLGRDLELAYAD